ncbi:LPXTG cell wall anchor domain-containing protein [Egicoccus sp. AB-alg2]|uniref:LPXTG cell wall anchor domain-containing protein n=1 Tax=Egicoccus sp. AB-alg2 TaxID=3242693 RepID=UPI00359DCEC7
MKKRIRSLVVLAISTLAVMAMSIGTAFAQYPPGEDFGVSCGTWTTPGDTVTCSVVGAQGGEELVATAQHTTVFYTDTFNADAQGEAAFSFAVPQDAAGETITVTVVGAESGTAGDEVEVVEDEDDARDDDGAGVGVTPGTGTGTGTLPFTGSQVTVLTAVGLALLAMGLLALRRREDAKVSA